VQAERLAGALGERLAVRHEGAEAADVDIPQVRRRFAADDPLGDQLARAARVRDAAELKPAATKQLRSSGASPRMKLPSA
jgi:hypothetical protein